MKISLKRLNFAVIGGLNQRAFFVIFKGNIKQGFFMENGQFDS